VVSQANPLEISDEIPSRHWSDFWIGLTVLVAFLCRWGNVSSAFSLVDTI